MRVKALSAIHAASLDSRLSADFFNTIGQSCALGEPHSVRYLIEAG